MNLLLRIWRSSLGKKYVMALTGAALFVFLIGHLVGNLQVFGKPELINRYAALLKSQPGLLWGARIGLLACVGMHIAAAVTLLQANRAARPVGYAGGDAYGSTLASRVMPMSGLVILAFIIYHLLHFTAMQPGINGVGDFSKLRGELDGKPVTDVYAMMILGFQVWSGGAGVSGGPDVVVPAPGTRVGLDVPVPRACAIMCGGPGSRVFARVASLALFIGYGSIPVAIVCGWVGEGLRGKVEDSVGDGKHSEGGCPLTWPL